jgi:hypothetical protein
MNISCSVIFCVDYGTSEQIIISELELPHFPTIMIEVLSLDTWNRFRTEGYTYLTIPGQPGYYINLVLLSVDLSIYL